ncbi:Cucumisin [Handroanthus impetiginosus]|uniref:Cucumisin n=1 Tax=Handroanthus impetiginosus TaxID=429701 RepID=A0A2G9GLN8_9LAMI|nr:Cucumisin [Handroanthus impetiginosus]
MSQVPILSLIVTLILQLSSANANDSSLQTYIVHVDLPDIQLLSEQSQDLESWYNSFLPTTIATSTETSRMAYSYRNVFSGFAAKLTCEGVKSMQEKKGFISARPQQILPLHTTHTPNFLGLHQNMGFWKQSNYGNGIIIGVLDTGIFPNHPSFNDEGMPPPPPKWKGPCEFNFTGACNNKLIGARHFRNGDGTPLDFDGHGTHTAATAAGNFVRGANLSGLANGTAVGIAPLAHLAMYKVCSPGCSESDILAAMDAAIEDGVDVLSISLGGPSRPFHEDNIALGAFSAMEKGIFVSSSAGNYGPFNLSLANEAPWILTVGASTTDRKLMATAVLGNNQELNGESAFQPKDFANTQLSLVYPGSNVSDFNAVYCSKTSLDNVDAQGKIVLCQVGGRMTSVEKGRAVRDAGGAAMILINPKSRAHSTFADAHVIPATNLNYEDGLRILAYVNSTSTPTASIVFKGTITGDKNSPVVASFSSRGPSRSSPGILKPDIIGPGVNILAAWHLSVENNANTKSNFNIISGTSMLCPHLSGVAALLKSAHPDWSPAAIKSAIMTTADTMNLQNEPILDERHLPADIFATGAGHVNPARANDPGLIYDIEPREYLPYLCGLNYTQRQIFAVLQHRVNYTAESRIPEGQLNYPSFSFRPGLSHQTFDTNSDKCWGATILNFSELNQKLSFEVTFRRLGNAANTTVSQGYILWKSANFCDVMILGITIKITTRKLGNSDEKFRRTKGRRRIPTKFPTELDGIHEIWENKFSDGISVGKYIGRKIRRKIVRRNFCRKLVPTSIFPTNIGRRKFYNFENVLRVTKE